MRKIEIGSDHAGFDLKEALKVILESEGNFVMDHGTYNNASADYPDYAHKTAEAVLANKDMGILICGSANGVCISANKHNGIRAALCWKLEIAGLARKHNNANIICIPARYVTEKEAWEMVRVFMETEFEGGRHETRVNKIDC
ncbi:MAG: ribose 5-phosphate isomerase B [Flavobacteriales bacterium]|nr:ribose 5-phosphate isomerase B [Flavobacteriales bacterium]